MTSRKFKNLMIMGGMALITTLSANNTFAQETPIKLEQSTVIHHIKDLLNKQYKNHTISHDMSIKYQELKEESENDINSLKIRGGECELDVGFYKDGNIVKLVQDEDTLNFTKLKNEKQKELAQDFIILHEASHCEFETIENPVKDFNKGDKFNSDLNYALRDFWHTIHSNADNNQTFYRGYVSYLNETYADVNAIIGLIKSNATNSEIKSGHLNEDLNYTINSIITQREVNFLTRVSENKIADFHYSSFALKELMNPENLSKIANLNTNKEIKEFAINLSNKGTQKALGSNDTLRNNVLSTISNQNIIDILSSTLGAIKENSKLSIEQAINEATLTLKGFNFSSNSKNLVKELIKKEDLNKIKDLSDEEIYEKSQKIILEVKNDSYANYIDKSKIIREFKKDIAEQYKDLEQINPKNVENLVEKAKENFTSNIEYNIDKSKVTNRISDLRNKAYNQNQNTNKFQIK